MKNKKKVLIIVAIVLIIIIALAGTALGMVLTGKVAITSKQKLAKGLVELTDKISIEEAKGYEKMKTTPFEMQNVITANINKMELQDTSELQELLDEVNSVIKDTKITNTLQADLKNNIIKENLKVNLADIVKEISADVEYSNDRLSLRSKELNQKYLTLTKRDVESSTEYNELINIFKVFEEICNNETVNLSLTEAEKTHFAQNYKDIFADYIKDSMIKDEKAQIVVDGETIKCDNVNFTLGKNQITELFEIYLNKLNQDTEGKNIIVNKFKSIDNSFSDQDLQKFIEDLKDRLSYLDEDINIKVSIYCTMFKTYGMNIKIEGIVDEQNTAIEINMILGKTNNIITINFPTGNISIKSENNKIEMVLEIYVEEYDAELKFSLTNEVVNKTENSKTTKSTIGMLIQEEQNAIDIILNVDSSFRYINTIDTMQNSDSINVLQESDKLQEYSNEVVNNLTSIIQNATQNSELIKNIYYLASQSQSFSQANELTSKEFNSMFQDYTGNPSGESIKTLLQTLATSNQTNRMHKISVSIIENETTILNTTTEPQEISAATININPNNQYTILVTSLDNAGYITGIQIKKI